MKLSDEMKYELNNLEKNIHDCSISGSIKRDARKEILEKYLSKVEHLEKIIDSLNLKK